MDRAHRRLDGTEDLLSALGLILNCVVLWNSVYLNRAIEELHAQDYPVRDEDAVWLMRGVRDRCEDGRPFVEVGQIRVSTSTQ
ncbi:Tn3 family transposase [Nocardia sp. MW-W600-9]